MALLAIAWGLSACSSATVHTNANNPAYGDLQYETDLTACRKLHSTVTSIQGYDVQTKVTTDQAAVAACMTERGWQTVSR